MYSQTPNKQNPVVSCPYFTTNLLAINAPYQPDYSLLDSFVIYMCAKGTCTLKCPQTEPVTLSMGETVLIPAAVKEVEIIPEGAAEILEVFIK